MSIRQEKVATALQRDLAQYFQQNTRTVCKGAMVSVTVVRVSPDLTYAKVYVSIFGSGDPKEILQSIKDSSSRIRGYLAQKDRSMRKVPDLAFYLDDSLDYAEEIDRLLKDD